MVSPVVPLFNTPLLTPVAALGRSLGLVLLADALPDGKTAALPDRTAGPVAAGLPAPCASPDEGNSSAVATVSIDSF